jgi:hypothetical protein
MASVRSRAFVRVVRGVLSAEVSCELSGWVEGSICKFKPSRGSRSVALLFYFLLRSALVRCLISRRIVHMCETATRSGILMSAFTCFGLAPSMAIPESLVLALVVAAEPSLL